MAEYINDLRELVSGQVEKFITNVMREQSDNDYGTRVNLLKQKKPNVDTPSEKSGATSLIGSTIDYTNNNPLYYPNMLDRLNTPFDHLERIMLQDFSSTMGLPEDKDNQSYIRSIFDFSFKGGNDYSLTSIKLYDDTNISKTISGDFFLESFTYTPYIDYATSNIDDGIYSDEGLNKYNNGYYDVASNFVDVNRHKMSSNLYTLRNLEQDLFDEKISWRNAVANADEKTYIYTFCEHLFTLFAKLSNIRMCHEIYGLKTPHYEYEGILALDIWYQLLYKKIDCKYAFNDDYLGMNPGTVDDDGNFSWNSTLWESYKSTSTTIHDERKNNVLPRGVLNSIWTLINTTVPTSEISDKSSGDFAWFKQDGKIYSDSNKSEFSKYVNLHLGRAYEQMTPKEYFELTNEGYSNNTYCRPEFSEAKSTILVDMLVAGCKALQDAFNVILNEKLFNIYNSNTNNIEVFNPSHKDYYSQAQCAIVIERIFSRIYKYLNFKSTTTETFQQRINIDSGYKYLATESILNSEVGNTPYYYEEDEVPYLRYLDKVQECLDSNVITDSNEKEVLENALAVLSTKAPEWLEQSWDLCPLQKTSNDEESDEVGEISAKLMSARSSSSTSAGVVFVDMNILNYMDIGSPSLPSSVTWLSSGNNKIAKKDIGSTGVFNLSTLNVFNPSFTYNGTSFNYVLAGYTTSKDSTQVVYPVNGTISAEDLDNGSLTLYAVWKGKYLIEFNRGTNVNATGSMGIQVVEQDTITKLNECGFTDPRTQTEFVYHSNSMWQSVSSSNNGAVKQLNCFKNWTYQFNGKEATINDKGLVLIPSVAGAYPVITLSAQWTSLYDSIKFKVNGETYCDVLISTSTNQLIKPKIDPVLTDTNYIFIGWDMADGNVLSGINRSKNVICGTERNPLVCEQGGSTDQIVCYDESVYEYNGCVNALIADAGSNKFSITFYYLDQNGQRTSKTDYVEENHTVPQFHIHDSVKTDDASYKFRYWELKDGNITSSLTVLSDVVFEAVYDKINIESSEEIDEQPDVVTLDVKSDERDEHAACQCEYISSGLNKDNLHYCTFNRTSPKDGMLINQQLSADLSQQFIVTHCPIINGLKRVFSKNNDFSEMTLLEISDIDLLVKALLKINIYIAHNEYFLKTDIPNELGWWYGYTQGEDDYILCESPYENETIICKGTGDSVICGENLNSQVICRNVNGELICGSPDGEEEEQVICGSIKGAVICGNIKNSQVVCSSKKRQSTGIVCGSPEKIYISFEPTIELKFSNLHAVNQVYNGKLVCTVDTSDNASIQQNLTITPINRELIDANGIHYSDDMYCYDYRKSLQNVIDVNGVVHTSSLSDSQKYYSINQLCAYEDSAIQSPTDVNGFVKHRLGEIPRTNNQVQTYTSIVKKYRPIIVPNVRDIFNDCVNDYTKYEVDTHNSYGVFGWCTIPSKTMVNMEYNEHSIIVPSSYDHHNRVGGSNFLQMDKDFDEIYNGNGQSNIDKTWYYLYNERDWTYFMPTLFNLTENNDLYSYMEDTYDEMYIPKSSDHINGVIFEPSNLGRDVDVNFGNYWTVCQFLASHHHSENNLELIAEKSNGLVSYSKLKSLTCSDEQFNSIYGSNYGTLPSEFRFNEQDWVDDYDKTSTNTSYKYNLGMRHSIDDGDEDSVWFYITMVEPQEELEQVIEVEDIMPFVFWWSNRGQQNNGPTVNCYGLESNAKLNYDHGYCYESSKEHDGKAEERWHAVQRTLGVDFSNDDYGNVIVPQDNSGNVYKGAFDPTRSATDVKWKTHHPSNSFGTNQGEDPSADKYGLGYEASTDSEELTTAPDGYNDDIIASLKDKPMTWNLWNVIRHYCYIKYFKNQGRTLDGSKDLWDELERKTKKYVKAIYRTFREHCGETFGDVDETATNSGSDCVVRWTNSFIQIQSIFERNAREHDSSLVLYTGNGLNSANNAISYNELQASQDNFIVTTLDGVDSEKYGMPESKTYVDPLNNSSTISYLRFYNGYKNEDLPAEYIIGETQSYAQMSAQVDISFSPSLNLDETYPYSEYYLNDQTKKWVRQIIDTVLITQMLPFYTTMETLTDENGNLKAPGRLTESEMKSITFQVIPQMYWRYEWTYNEFMIHPVGRLHSSGAVYMWDMLGNVWEWVRDDYISSLSELSGRTNPIAGTAIGSTTKVIKGGAFDQFCRRVISGNREGLSVTSNRSECGTQANVGFRPALNFTQEKEGGSFTLGSPVDLFFLFDASASQNNQITQMIQSANEIVKMFASESPDDCHVGSALFLGPNIRLMCAQKWDDVQSRWMNTVRTTQEELIKTKGHGDCRQTSYTHNTLRDYNPGKPDKSTYDVTSQDDTIQDLYNKFIAYKENWQEMMSGETSSKGFSMDDDTSYSFAKINDFEEEEQVSEPIEQDETYGFNMSFNDVDVESISDVENKENVSLFASSVERNVSFKSVPFDMTFSSRDGAGVSGHSSGSSSWDWECHGHYTDYYEYWYVWSYPITTYKLHTFSGVPVYKVYNEESEQLIYGCDKSYTSPNATSVSFNHTYNLFTYDPTRNGISTFEWPFVLSDKGGLSNWWAGCEPVSDIVSKLLNGGFFYRKPYQYGVGYMFRKDVPKVLFLFSNEYDNQLQRIGHKTYTEENEILVIPCGHNGVLNIMKVLLYAKTNVGDYTDDSCDQNAPDPYCTQILREGTSNISDFIKTIGIKESDTDYSTIMSGINWMVGSENGNINENSLRYLNIYNGRHSSSKLDEEYLGFLHSYVSADYEGDGKALNEVSCNLSNLQELSYNLWNPITKLLPKNILSQKLYNILMNTRHRTGEDFEGGAASQAFQDFINNGYDLDWGGIHLGSDDLLESFGYDAVQTIGFYQLADTFSTQLEDSVNTYYMVCDANAPKSIDDGLFFLANDIRFFKDIYEVPLPASIQSKIYNAVGLSNATWKDLVGINTVYWGTLTRHNYIDGASTIFGGYENPYKKNTIVYAFLKHYPSAKNTMITRYNYVALFPFDDDDVPVYTDTSTVTKVINSLKDKTTDWMSTHIIKIEDWYNNASTYNRYNLDETNCSLHFIDINKTFSYTRTNMSIKFKLTKNTTGKYTITKTDGGKTTSKKSTTTNLTEDWNSDIKIDTEYQTTEIKQYQIKSIGNETDGYYVSKSDGTFIKDSDPETTTGIALEKLEFTQTSVTINYTNIDGEDKTATIKNSYLELSDVYYEDKGKTIYKIARDFDCSINKILSSESFNIVGDDTVRTSSPQYYVTISYAGGGTLKIVALNKDDVTASGKKTIDIEANNYDAIFNSSYSSYPEVWKNEISYVCNGSNLFDDYQKYGASKISKLFDSTNDENNLNSWLFEFYSNIKAISPTLMAYRYWKYMFSQYTNTAGKSVIDYDDESNYIIAKPLPIMDVTNMSEIFKNSFGSGQFNTASKFSYKNAVIDLNPNLSNYNKLEQGQFPLKFCSVTDVNVDDYKTSKIVLSRIPEISGAQDSPTSFTMGTKITDYNEVTDTLSIKYADVDSIATQAQNINATVTLTNGGSYQKTNDIYAKTDSDGKELYFKNKHFFIDPFELTIAQWCYVNGKNTQASARSFLGDKITEMAYSYLKEQRIYEGNTTADETDATQIANYNPLTDTRPYYYATYNDVRGRTDLYDGDTRNTFTPNGEEFQLNSVSNMSFLGILNSKVAYNTVKRTYTIDSNGMKILDEDAYAAEKSSEGKTWPVGESAGLNFDLPTEAQWEYCCRQGSTNAFPDKNLGQVFETNDTELDLIAWYKYKVIGTLPEPERFATWRISKMIFGISKDTEQVNNVYEID